LRKTFLIPRDRLSQLDPTRAAKILPYLTREKKSLDKTTTMIGDRKSRGLKLNWLKTLFEYVARSILEMGPDPTRAYF